MVSVSKGVLDEKKGALESVFGGTIYDHPETARAEGQKPAIGGTFWDIALKQAIVSD